MGEPFVAALESELALHQRSVSSNCLFCVPQAQSLAAHEKITQDDLFTHFLTPFTPPADASSAVRQAEHHQVGEYCTLNGKCVSIVGSYIHTKTGFHEKRIVRILLSEQREIQHQQITVIHLSRPLVNGIAVPEDPNEIDVATFRRYTAILRAFPENEWVFAQLNETIAQVERICAHDQFQTRYASQLPRLLEQEWHHAVEELLQTTDLAMPNNDDDNGSHASSGSNASHDRTESNSVYGGRVLQIQQVVECLLLEPLHRVLLPQMLVRCHREESQLFRVLNQMQHFTPQDFHIRKEFQCHSIDARDELTCLGERKTPLDLLLALKKCIDAVNESLLENLKRHHHVDYEAYQLTTDDLLDQVLYVIIQAFRKAHEDTNWSSVGLDVDFFLEVEGEEDTEARNDAAVDVVEEKLVPVNLLSKFPLVSCLQYIEQYHFINSNTTKLGFTLANFQVALAFFLLRAKQTSVNGRQTRRQRSSCTSLRVHDEDQNDDDDDGSVDARDGTSMTKSMGCNRVALVRRAYVRNMKAIRAAVHEAEVVSPSSCEEPDSKPTDDGKNRLVVLGDWSTEEEEEEDKDGSEEEDHEQGNVSWRPADHEEVLTCHEVDLTSLAKDEIITQMNVGSRYFGFVTSEGRLFTFGDRAGGRLGIPLVDGMPKRLVQPRLVEFGSLGLGSRVRIVQVACGAFHTLCCDLNGHVHAWGQNSCGQLGFLPNFSRGSSDSSDRHQGMAVDAPSCASSNNCCNYTELPRRVEDLRGDYINSVACGETFSLALASSGKVFSWGSNQFHQLGRNTSTFIENLQPQAVVIDWKNRPMEPATATTDVVEHSLGTVATSPTVCRISAGSHHALAITREGAVFTWGKNDSGQLGLGSFADAWVPQQVLALSHPRDGFVVDAGGGAAFSAFLLRNGLCFVCGMIGDNTARTSSSGPPLLTPKLLQWPSNLTSRSGSIAAIGCGASQLSLLLTTGSVIQCPVDAICRDTMQWTTVQQAVEPTGVKKIASGASHSLALL